METNYTDEQIGAAYRQMQEAQRQKELLSEKFNKWKIDFDLVSKVLNADFKKLMADKDIFQLDRGRYIVIDADLFPTAEQINDSMKEMREWDQKLSEAKEILGLTNCSIIEHTEPKE